jgi:DNA-binding transcriptional regulator YiaG
MSRRVATARTLASVERLRLFAEQTDDAGAKLRLQELVTSEGTGEVDDGSYRQQSLERPEFGAFGTAKNVVEEMAPHTQAVFWIQSATGLSEGRVAELLDVERMTVRNWKAGKRIKDTSSRRLFEIKDVLQRAQRWHAKQDELVTWLYTPDREQGISPARLLLQGEFDRARFLAVLKPSKVESTPQWARRPVPAAWRGALEVPERPGEFVEDLS